MGVTLTDVLLFGKAQSDDVDNATLVIYRRNILRWSALGGYLDVIVKGVSPLVLPDAIANSLSYVKAFGGTYQGNIPNTYTQVNYVTNTAQTAVDTGVMIDFSKNYEFEVECRAVSGSWYILQSRASSSGNITGIHGATSGSTITLVVGNVTVCTSAITRTVGNKLYVKATLNAGTATLYVKDETANTEDTQTGSYGTSQPNPTASVYLLGNAGGQYVDVNSDIYMARIKENDTVVMDYVPARQVATAGFYDKASGTFKTALTPANLSADGNTVPTPDAPMDIVCNNGVLKYRDTELPVGYKRVQDIIFDGETYYVTDIYLTGADTTSFVMNAAESGRNVLGCYTGYASGNNISLYLFIGSSGCYVRYKDSLYRPVIASAKLNTDLSLSIGPTGTTGFDTKATWTELEFTCPDELCIGWLANATSAKFVGSFKGNITVSNRATLVPCERVSDGEIGYYNLNDDVFFANQGTGTPTTTGYDYSHYAVIADGTVETIQATSKNLFAYTSLFDTYVTAITYHTFDIPNGTYTMSSPDFPVGQSNATNVFVFAGTATSGASSSTNGVTSTTPRTITVTDGKYTVAYRSYNSNNTNDPKDFRWQLELGSTATAYAPYYNGGTATAEMLLKIGSSQDEQEILTGAVTRNVQVIIFDGTESFSTSSAYGDACVTTGAATRWDCSKAVTPICTHFLGVPQATGAQPVNTCFFNASGHFYFRLEDNTVATFKAWLAAQYAAGTPVMVLVNLLTPTTESVAGQTLQVTDGDNTLEITQASLTGLELEAKYKAAVSLTIQEVQDANLDPNVEVTIN